MLKKVKKYMKIILIFIGVFFSIIGFLCLIAIINYNFSQSNFQAIYKRNLSEKISMDRWEKEKEEYDKLSQEKREMGEIRIYLKSGQLDLENINPLNDKIIGTIITNEKKYKAKVDPYNFNITQEGKNYSQDWHWYNWLGIGLNN